MTTDETIVLFLSNPRFVRLFRAKYAESDECWLWTGGTERKGYGRVHWTYGGKQRDLFAHRIAWTLAHGNPPGSMLVCHKCDTPPCVNPEHLFLGTDRENTNDAVNKCLGRYRMTDERVRLARTLAASGETQKQIASRLGVSQSTVSMVLTGATRGYVQ